MTTPWILLHRTVNFIDGTGTATAIRGLPNPAEAMAAMKPAMAIAEPPEVTYLSMLRQTRAENMGGSTWRRYLEHRRRPRRPLHRLVPAWQRRLLRVRMLPGLRRLQQLRLRGTPASSR
jgi:hypothetical protein